SACVSRSAGSAASSPGTGSPRTGSGRGVTSCGADDRRTGLRRRSDGRSVRRRPVRPHAGQSDQLLPEGACGPNPRSAGSTGRKSGSHDSDPATRQV
ncbi:hypothetical protein KKF05_01725, partial [Patescibacteria group bacterium]|nr:hypothetical protein [Patescibacteria group bacterium]